MSIIKLKPGFKDYMWGGHRLVEEYGKDFDGEILAESWELSCYPDTPSTIVNGVHAGKTLRQYIEEQGKGVLGTNCRRFEDFPILIQLIDAKSDLSVQVHPDNEYALKNEGQTGKTEMWYVLDKFLLLLQRCFWVIQRRIRRYFRDRQRIRRNHVLRRGRRQFRRFRQSLLNRRYRGTAGRFYTLHTVNDGNTQRRRHNHKHNLHLYFFHL